MDGFLFCGGDLDKKGEAGTKVPASPERRIANMKLRT